MPRVKSLKSPFLRDKIINLGGFCKRLIRLTPEERTRLEGMIHCGKGEINSVLKARILLKTDVSENGPGWSDERIAEALETSLSTVLRTRRQFVEEGLNAALSRKKSSWSPRRIFDGESEAKLIALACSEPPKGYAQWTMKMLEKRVVELGIVEKASDTTIHRVLKRNEVKPHKKKYWVIHPKRDKAFATAMDNVLKIYTLPPDPARPLVCLDETSKQLIQDTREPLPYRPGRVKRIDYEYKRNGVVNLFMLFAPLLGWRKVPIRKRRTAIDYAYVLRDLVDVYFPFAEMIMLVQDNLNTHVEASLYKAFPPEEAARIAARIEMNFTPIHGSWLNMAECEISVLSRQCLARRIPDQETLTAEVEAWEANRNGVGSKCNWQFTTQDARTKLKHLYPEVEENSALAAQSA